MVRRAIALVWVLACTVVLSASSFGAKRVDRFAPADCLVFVYFNSAAEGWEETNLHKLANDDELKDFVERIVAYFGDDGEDEGLIGDVTFHDLRDLLGEEFVLTLTAPGMVYERDGEGTGGGTNTARTTQGRGGAGARGRSRERKPTQFTDLTANKHIKRRPEGEMAASRLGPDGKEGSPALMERLFRDMDIIPPHFLVVVRIGEEGSPSAEALTKLLTALGEMAPAPFDRTDGRPKKRETPRGPAGGRSREDEEGEEAKPHIVAGTELHSVKSPRMPVALRYATKRDLFMISTSTDLLGKAVKGRTSKNALTSGLSYKRVRRIAGGDAILSVRYNVNPLFEFAEKLEDCPIRELLDAGGLDGFRKPGRLDALLSPQGEGMKLTGFLKTSEESGWLTVVSDRSIDEDVLSLIPRNVTSFAVGALDLGRAHGLVMDLFSKELMAELKPVKELVAGTQKRQRRRPGRGRRREEEEEEEEDDKAPTGLAGVIAEFEEVSGVSIKNDFLDALGPEVGLFLSDLGTGALVPSVMFIGRCSDENSIDSFMEGVVKYFTERAGGREDDDEDAFGRVARVDQGEHTIRILRWPSPLPSVAALSYTFSEGYLIAGASPMVIREYLIAIGEEEGSIADSEDFQKVRREVSPSASTMYYEDSRAAFRALYGMIGGLLPIAEVFSAELPVDVTMLPPVSAFDKYLFGSVCVSLRALGETRFECYSPTGFILTDFAGASKNVSPMLLARVVTPLMTAMHRKAIAARSSDNLKQIGEAVVLYAKDHKGIGPRTLSRLVKSDYLAREKTLRDPAVAIADRDGDADYMLRIEISEGTLRISDQIAPDEPLAWSDATKVEETIYVFFAGGTVKSIDRSELPPVPKDAWPRPKQWTELIEAYRALYHGKKYVPAGAEPTPGARGHPGPQRGGPPEVPPEHRRPGGPDGPPGPPGPHDDPRIQERGGRPPTGEPPARPH